MAFRLGYDDDDDRVSGQREDPFVASLAGSTLVAVGVAVSVAPVSVAIPLTTTNVSAPPSWISSLNDSVLRTDMTAIAASGSVTEVQMAKVFTDLTSELKSNSAALSASQFVDLKSISTNLSALGASSYVQYVTNALVNGNVANQTWTGGGSAVALGNFGVGASATTLNELTGKWFLGADDPASAVSMDGEFSVSYHATALPLFGANGPSASDVNQGYLGDCYLLGPLAEVAAKNPEIIEQMISSNGNGTYGVTFHFGGNAYYVTVDATLPDGGTIFNSGTSAWASLIEKAYAELPTTTALEGNSGSYSNSFTTIANGGDPTAALEEITGATSLTEFAANGLSWLSYGLNSSENWNGSETTLSTASALSALAADLAVGSDLVLTSLTDATDSSGMTTLVASHAMSVYGFDASTGELEIRNPWGYEGAYQSWDTTFEVGLGTLLADNDSIVSDNMGVATSVAGTSVVAAAGLQSMAQVKSFSVSDTVANISSALSALEADTKLTSLTVKGTSSAEAINLSGFTKAATINLGSDLDVVKLTGATKAVSGVSSATSLNLGRAYNLATLGSGAETVDYAIGSGVLDVSNFSAAHDLLSVNLNGATLLQTIVGGSDWISSTSDTSHGVLLAGVSTAQHVTVIRSVATVV